MAANNKSLGKFSLDGIPPAPRGVPQIEVTFDIDADGILKVGASDKATGRSQNITIHASSGLTDEEVEQMRQDAEAHAEEDRKRRELVEARNAADNAIYAVEKMRREAGDRLDDELRAEIGEKISALRAASEAEDIENLLQATDELLRTSQKVAGVMQQAEEVSEEAQEDQVPQDEFESEEAEAPADEPSEDEDDAEEQDTDEG